MKTKVISIAVLFALLVLGTVFIAVPNEAATADTTADVYNIDNGVYTVASISCSRYCSWCVKLGNNGACTTAGICC